ncbi:MAG: hypothetical protein AB1762_15340 [Gemmatimonadota bacterium]
MAALVAGAVSLAVGLLSMLATWRTIRSADRKHERELQRRLTEKLIERRLQIYPRAFEITDALRGEYLFQSPITEERLRTIRQELIQWDRSEAALIMSRQCLEKYRVLRDVLDVQPFEGNFTSEQLERIWTGKNEFRKCMRADVNLLYAEELAGTRNETLSRSAIGLRSITQRPNTPNEAIVKRT